MRDEHRLEDSEPAAPGEAGAPELPVGWEMVFDEESREFYYHHGVTGRSQWEHPAGDGGLRPKELDSIFEELIAGLRREMMAIGRADGAVTAALQVSSSTCGRGPISVPSSGVTLLNEVRATFNALEQLESKLQTLSRGAGAAGGCSRSSRSRSPISAAPMPPQPPQPPHPPQPPQPPHPPLPRPSRVCSHSRSPAPRARPTSRSSPQNGGRGGEERGPLPRARGTDNASGSGGGRDASGRWSDTRGDERTAWSPNNRSRSPLRTRGRDSNSGGWIQRTSTNSRPAEDVAPRKAGSRGVGDHDSALEGRSSTRSTRDDEVDLHSREDHKGDAVCADMNCDAKIIEEQVGTTVKCRAVVEYGSLRIQGPSRWHRNTAEADLGKFRAALQRGGTAEAQKVQPELYRVREQRR